MFLSRNVTILSSQLQPSKCPFCPKTFLIGSEASQESSCRQEWSWIWNQLQWWWYSLGAKPKKDVKIVKARQRFSASKLLSVKASSAKRRSRHDLPAPESPMRTCVCCKESLDILLPSASPIVHAPSGTRSLKQPNLMITNTLQLTFWESGQLE